MSPLRNTPVANNHISVDCVVIGFDGEQLRVLLQKRTVESDGVVTNDMKLPGSLIYQDEDLDAAAQRVLQEYAGIKKMPLIQFKAFGSKDRTKKKMDVIWLERTTTVKVDRIVTVAYLAMVKISPNNTTIRANGNELCWVPLDDVQELAFDHNIIIGEAIKRVRQQVESEPQYLFHLLPAKFTAALLRTLFERIYNKDLDARNFQKKMNLMTYVLPLDEFERDVAHRAARYYRFDKVAYNKMHR